MSVKRVLAAIAAVAALVAYGVVAAQQADPGPIPTCDGQQATIVGVAPGTAGDYAEWEAQGVDVQDSPEGLIRGTTGSDVLVGLVATADPEVGTGNGFYSGGTASIGPADQHRQGDLACGYGDGFDIYYMGRSADRVFDLDPPGGRPGDSHVYLGGCTEGLGCDYVEAGDGLDKIWGFKVPTGKTQTIFGGDGWEHVYAGLGNGRVVVDGGPCTAPTGGTCVGAVPGDGDHIHPCPEGTNGGKVTHTGIEYFGPSAPFGDNNPPCAYNG